MGRLPTRSERIHWSVVILDVDPTKGAERLLATGRFTILDSRLIGPGYLVLCVISSPKV